MSAQTVSPWSERIGGLVLLIIGLLAVAQAQAYPFGTVSKMGPGFFPVVTGTVLAGFGALIAWKTPDAGQEKEGALMNLRPAFFIFAGLLAWALLLKPAGLVIATVAMALLAAFAYPKPNLVRIAITVVLLPIVGVALFIFGLGMPLRAFPW
ncbi:MULTISPECIES: tripartite tricarboxylate transporter TctB family protein [unclassified Devosia]|uniref:tripartite tricarboxylate transporter TctB family protein n=1 Tax=unclassified Devosia TaxID=196773 RepID=UPI00145F72BD|nr:MULTISPECIES: tripartite tricarboxylate transporter TctB family protein [unclassified Devosia]MBJ6989117.1 tripartite tricarboxylate transporter TctB family protein [Devosia sp. MC521]QMW63317.1 tripartite tricarboxylate transporter TctB family protein [Devosia sp. MC521]